MQGNLYGWVRITAKCFYFFSALNLIIIILKPRNSKIFSVILFKGATKLQFTHYSCAVSILLNKSLYKSAFSTYIFGKLVALPFCTFCVYFFCVKFDVIFLKFYNIIIYIVRVRCFCSHLIEAICKNRHVIIIWLQLIIKTCLQRAPEF